MSINTPVSAALQQEDPECVEPPGKTVDHHRGLAGIGVVHGS
jgi:hypothetical protein